MQKFKDSLIGSILIALVAWYMILGIYLISSALVFAACYLVIGSIHSHFQGSGSFTDLTLLALFVCFIGSFGLCGPVITFILYVYAYEKTTGHKEKRKNSTLDLK